MIELIKQIGAALDKEERIALAAGKHSVEQAWRPGTARTCSTCGSFDPRTPRPRTHACTDGWHQSPESDEYAIVIDDAGFRMAATPGSPPRAAQIARQDPAATLRRVAAHRELLDVILSEKHRVVDDTWYTCPAATFERDGGSSFHGESDCECGRDERVGRGLRILAKACGIEVPAWSS